MEFQGKLHIIQEGAPVTMVQNPSAFYRFMAPIEPSIREVQITWFSSPQVSETWLKAISLIGSRCFDSRSGRTKSPRRVAANDFAPSHSSKAIRLSSRRISVEFYGERGFPCGDVHCSSCSSSLFNLYTWFTQCKFLMFSFGFANSFKMIDRKLVSCYSLSVYDLQHMLVYEK